MDLVRCHQSISLDGFTAGPNQSIENPIGEGGMRLHQWMFETAAWRRMQGLPGGPVTPDSAVVEDIATNAGTGAYVMGRNMFGGGDGEWDLSWRGWWGENPPYHAPVFVLTHHPRATLSMQGGTTFYFVTEGIDAALRRACAAAKERDVQIAGGASTVRQFLRAGYVDELNLHIVPVVLGKGERLLDGLGGDCDVLVTPVSVIASPAVTHIKYRIEH